MEQVKVALLIGDIYDQDEIPEPFKPMAKVISYDEDANNTRVTMNVSDETVVQMTAVSIAPFNQQISRLSQGADTGNAMAAHRRAIQIVVNERVDSPLNAIRKLEPDIFVIGQTVLFEEVARNIAWRKQGLWNPLMIRFSSFYGGSNAYTGISADEVGYDLDIPKKLIYLKGLLSFEPFLKAVLAKDESALREALSTLNLKTEFVNNQVLWVKATGLD